ncbi:hypothetical protein CsSME_00007186 [Camellia sinensis var. sinensis]
MERDFLGLNSKDSVVVVKEEAVEGCKDSAFSKGSGVQWPLSNKVSALPPFMSFKVAQDEMKPKVMSDPLAASGFMSISTAHALNHLGPPIHYSYFNIFSIITYFNIFSTQHHHHIFHFFVFKYIYIYIYIFFLFLLST